MSATCRTFVSAESLAGMLRRPRPAAVRLSLRPDATRRRCGTVCRRTPARRALCGSEPRPCGPGDGHAAAGIRCRSPAIFAATLRDWGVNSDSRVVAYDERNGAYAARLWWMLRWLGHDADVRTRRRLRALDRARAGDHDRRAAAAHARQLCGGHPAVDGGRRRGRARRPARRRSRVLDARAAERFRGDVEPIDRVAGSHARCRQSALHRRSRRTGARSTATRSPACSRTRIPTLRAAR